MELRDALFTREIISFRCRFENALAASWVEMIANLHTMSEVVRPTRHTSQHLRQEALGGRIATYGLDMQLFWRARSRSYVRTSPELRYRYYCIAVRGLLNPPKLLLPESPTSFRILSHVALSSAYPSTLLSHEDHPDTSSPAFVAAKNVIPLT